MCTPIFFVFGLIQSGIKPNYIVSVVDGLFTSPLISYHIVQLSIIVYFRYQLGLIKVHCQTQLN